MTAFLLVCFAIGIAAVTALAMGYLHDRLFAEAQASIDRLTAACARKDEIIRDMCDGVDEMIRPDATAVERQEIGKR